MVFALYVNTLDEFLPTVSTQFEEFHIQWSEQQPVCTELF